MTAQPKTLPARIAHDIARRNWRAATKAHDRATANERRERIKALKTHDRAPVIAAHAEAVRLFAAKENAYDQFRAALDAYAATR